jgi:hypothetical protein
VSVVANGRFPVRYSIVAMLALVSTFLSGSQFFPGRQETETTRLPSPKRVAALPPTLSPSAIPPLTEAVRERITGRRAPLSLADASPAAGPNPFLPLNVRRPIRKKAPEVRASPTQSELPAPKGDVAFWGAYRPSPEEPKQAIIAVRASANPWSGPIGSMITGTPYRLVKIGNKDRTAYLLDTRSPSRPPLVLPYEGLREEL